MSPRIAVQCETFIGTQRKSAIIAPEFGMPKFRGLNAVSAYICIQSIQMVQRHKFMDLRAQTEIVSKCYIMGE